MKAGLIGLSQAGKRTLFKLLTNREPPAVRREGEVVEGVATIFDRRVEAIADICKPERTRYAENSIVLLPDLGEESRGGWMEAARRCDLLCVVIRAFAAEEVYHPRGSVSPSRDRGDVEAELLIADLDLVERRLERLGKEKRAGLTPAQQVEERALAKCRDALAASIALREVSLDERERQALRSLGLLTLLPLVWTYNVDEGDVGKAREEFGAANDLIVSCRIEEEIMKIEDREERRQFLGDLGFEESGLDRMNAAIYDALGLMSFYTMGEDEVRAWTIRKGTAAPAAGGKIHTDIERGFIRVEVIKYDDLIAAGSEAAAKAAGKVNVKGRDYVIEDGDICHFLFSV